MIRGASLAALLLLASCATAQATPQLVTRVPVSLQVRILKSFTAGISETKTVGQTMIEREGLSVYPGFEIIEGFTIPNCFGTEFPPITKGAKWACMHRISTDAYSCWDARWGIATGSRKPPGFFYELLIDKYGGVIGIAETNSTQAVHFDNIIAGKTVPIDIPWKKLNKQELIYNGKSKDTIKISYHEYKDDMARPAFYQDLTYDLSESREIAFLDLRIEVLEATNSTIKFFVKK